MSEELFCVCTYCISFCKAFSAIVVFALHGSKGNRILFAAIGADDSGSLSLRSAGVLACLSASLATLRLIYKAFLSVEFLLSCGKNEFFAAILANECLVFVHEIYLALENNNIFIPCGFAPHKLFGTDSVDLSGTGIVKASVFAELFFDALEGIVHGFGGNIKLLRNILIGHTREITFENVKFKWREGIVEALLKCQCLLSLKKQGFGIERVVVGYLQLLDRYDLVRGNGAFGVCLANHGQIPPVDAKCGKVLKAGAFVGREILARPQKSQQPLLKEISFVKAVCRVFGGNGGDKSLVPFAQQRKGFVVTAADSFGQSNIGKIILRR